MKIWIKVLFPIIVGAILIISTLFLINENFGRAIVLLSSFSIWIGICLYTKKYIFTSILYTLFVLPFNITINIPLHVEFFNSLQINIQPFVEGIYSNYLVPTLSILDIGVFLILISFLFTKGVENLFNMTKGIKNILILFFVTLLITNIIHFDILVLLSSIRIFTYIVTLLFVTVWIKTEWKRKYINRIIILFGVSLLIQGVIGILQFNGGSSLGMNFLGESQVANGMQGSSFISLHNNIYLRAYGTFPHPNVFGGYLLFSFVLGWFGSICSKKYFKYLSYGIMVGSFVFSLFTFSRIAILLMLLGWALFFTSLFKKKVFKKQINSFSFLLIFERFLNLLGDGSWVDRKNLVVSSFQIIKNNWFLGTGLGRFVKYMENNIPRTSSGILLLQPVHNVVLLSFSELGVFSFIPFLLFFIQYFRKFIDLRKYFYLKIFILLIFTLVGLFDHYLFSLPQGLLISSILIILLSV